MSKNIKLVGKSFRLADHPLRFDNQGSLRLLDSIGETDIDCTSLIATAKEVKQVVAIANAFEVARKLESKLTLSGDYEPDDGEDLGVQVGCTFIPYKEIVNVLGKARK